MFVETGDILQVVAVRGLNIRRDANVKAPKLFSPGLAPGTTIQVVGEGLYELGEDYGPWYPVRVLDGARAGATGFVAAGEVGEKFLKKMGSAPPPPPPPPVHLKKFGAHVIGQNSESKSVIQLGLRAQAAGFPLASITVVDDVELANLLAGLFPKTAIFSRHRTYPIERNPDSYGWDALALFKEFWEVLKPGRGLVRAFQFWNEITWSPKSSGELPAYRDFVRTVCKFERESALIWKNEGINGCIGNFSVGHPYLEDPEALAMWRDMIAETCVGTGNVLVYHTGSNQKDSNGVDLNPRGNEDFWANAENFALHFDRLLSPGVNVNLSEARYGTRTGMDMETFMSWVRQMQQGYGTRPEVMGFDPFTFGATPENGWMDTKMDWFVDAYIDVITNG